MGARYFGRNSSLTEAAPHGSADASQGAVLPFSKRPPPPEEYFLRSGDFEAVRQERKDPYAATIPPAPRAPVFARQAAQTPYGFSQNQQQYSQFNDLSVTPPPHSLAPVAMNGGPDSTNRHFALGHTSRTNTNSVILREKPSLKWGVMIALSGALLGGVLGLGMDARRQNARAAAAASDARDNAPPAMVAAALPNALGAPRVAAAPVSAPVSAPIAANPAPVVLAPIAPVVVAPAKSEPAPKSHAKAPAPRPHTFVAAKVATPKAEKAEKAEAPPPEKTAKVEKAEKAEKPEPKTSAKKDASTTDAMKILEAANKDTTNTL
jgi:hypothetical protein